MFLRGAGATIALPLLDSLARRVGAAEPAETPRRMIAICTSLGLLAENWIPKRAGRDYDTPLYLEPLAKFRNDYTVFSGVSHPEVDGGHFSEASFLTAAPHPKASTFKNTISLDQYVVERLAPETRYPYLALGTYERSLSWTAGGVQIPADNSPSLLFRKLFVNGSPDEVETQVHRLRTGQSILDAALGQTKRIHRRLDGADREKLDQYMTAVRDVEQRLRTSEAWVHRPKPNVTLREPVDNANPADL
ncbi:MAG TPA: DUF1552 domain-containing protein, partial [Pirellulales bacterium]|nr:DUF1552 domain-containing protein [Pirellulales bacterium]